MLSISVHRPLAAAFPLLRRSSMWNSSVPSQDQAQERDVFARLQSGEAVPFTDPDYQRQIPPAALKTTGLINQLNNNTDPERLRSLWGELTGTPLDPTSYIQIPFFINIGRFTTIGKNVYINHAVSFLDMGTITIEDDVLIGPKANILTEGHPVNPEERRALTAQPIVIKRNAWIGAGATILPGVTVGENSIVAAGSVVRQDVPPNTVVGGIPAKVLKNIEKTHD